MITGKNWLIRTRSNHILGPVSKEKVVELYSNGSIKADDEVCTGNGYWFFLRETDLVERFLTGDEVQGFNPISEAKDVLTASGPNTRERTSDDITLIGSLNLKTLKDEPKPAARPAPKVEQFSAPEDDSNDVTEEDFIEEDAEPEAEKSRPEPKVEPKKKIKSEPEVKVSPTPRQAKALPKKQDYLFYLMAFFALVMLFMIYFRKTILGSFFNSDQVTSISFISEAHAQDEGPTKKKSSSTK